MTLGNHDPELALPCVRERLLDLLSGGKVGARGRITLGFDGAAYGAASATRRCSAITGTR